MLQAKPESRQSGEPEIIQGLLEEENELEKQIRQTVQDVFGETVEDIFGDSWGDINNASEDVTETK